MISLTVNLYSSTPQRPEALGPRSEQRPLYLGRDVKNTNRLTHEIKRSYLQLLVSVVFLAAGIS